MSYPTECPSCKKNLVGDLIWQYFRDHGFTEAECDKFAKQYGATRTEGNFNLTIGLYDMDKDRTTAWKCPDCGHEWSVR